VVRFNEGRAECTLMRPGGGKETPGHYPSVQFENQIGHFSEGFQFLSLSVVIRSGNLTDTFERLVRVHSHFLYGDVNVWNRAVWQCAIRTGTVETPIIVCPPFTAVKFDLFDSFRTMHAESHCNQPLTILIESRLTQELPFPVTGAISTSTFPNRVRASIISTSNSISFTG